MSPEGVFRKPPASKLFMTMAATSGSLHPDVVRAIRRKLQLDRGWIGARRNRRRDGSFSEWSAVICWREGGSTRCRTLGPLSRILDEIGLKGAYISGIASAVARAKGEVDVMELVDLVLPNVSMAFL